MSSTAVYEPKRIDTKEEDFDGVTPELRWCDRQDYPYDVIKRHAEYALWQKYADRKWVAVRYPFVIGEDDYTKRLLFYVEHAMKQQPMYIDWEVANLNKLHTVLVLAFSLAGLYFICLYVHRNYHYKFIYFPVLIVPVVERIANLISNRLVFTLSSPYTEYYVLTSRVQIAQNITSLVVSTVIFFILFIVFYLNKKNEKFIPHYYVICLITLIWGVINHGFAALYHLIISLDATAWFDANTVADFMYNNGYYITVLAKTSSM